MSYALTLVSAPAAEPVLLADLAAWCRVDITDDNAILTDLGIAAREYCEDFLGRAFITSTWKLTLDRFPLAGNPATWQQYAWGSWQQRIPTVNLTGSWWPDRASIRLPKAPCQSVSSVQYIDSNGVTQTLDPSLYNVDVLSEPARITPAYGQIWPILRQQMSAVSITYVAGYGNDGSSVPSRIKTAIRMLTAHWYEHREAVGEVPTGPLALAVENLLLSTWTGEYV